MSNFKKLLTTLTIALCALVINFILHKPDLAYILVAIAGGIMSLSMLIDMIKTLKSGQYGVDILAISAIIATLLVGDYWASLMILSSNEKVKQFLKNNTAPAKKRVLYVRTSH